VINIKKLKNKGKSCRNSFTIISIIILLSTTMISINIASLSEEKILSTIPTLRGDWEAQDSGTTHKLNGISFVDGDFGTAVGDSAVIVHTDDGGGNWNSQTVGVTVNLNDVSFYNSDIGMAVGTEGTILNTNNGGDNWNIYQTGWMIQYFGTHMVTDLVGFAVGENTIFQPLVTWTTDGWNSKNDVVFYLDGNEGKLYDVCFIDTNTGFAAAVDWTGEGAIVKTTDGGSNWNVIYWVDYGFYGIDFPTADVGYAVGNNGLIVKTSNGGDSWQSLNSGVNNDLADVSFPTEDIGIVVGKSGLIIRTEDGGDNWAEEESGTSNDLYSVDFLDPGNGYAAGDAGTILHYIGNLPPAVPVITGPTSGAAGVELEYIVVTTDPEGEDAYYFVEWGDGDDTGWIGPYHSGEEVTISHTWASPDDYEIRSKAKDINDLESEWSEALVLTIVVTDPPSPPTIKGTTLGNPGESYNYYFTSTDPDGDDVSYYVEWGDGEVIDWSDYQTSGVLLKKNHEFSETGTFNIRAKAKDIYNFESDWGELEVTMPRGKLLPNTFFLRLLERFPNAFPILRLLLLQLELQ
jgi:photosystem II stability/assembly factor-like uncharacterized protein